MAISDAEIEGRLFNYIRNFLKPSSFNVKLNKVLFGTKIQTESIPQGSVVSPTFFILKINRIIAQLPKDNRYPTAIQDCRTVERKLQDRVDNVEKFAQKNGFKFSTCKTSMLLFTKLSSPPPIELRLGNNRIQKSETFKYLVLVFDSKFVWKAHIPTAIKNEM